MTSIYSLIAQGAMPGWTVFMIDKCIYEYNYIIPYMYTFCFVIDIPERNIFSHSVDYFSSNRFIRYGWNAGSNYIDNPN